MVLTDIVNSPCTPDDTSLVCSPPRSSTTPITTPTQSSPHGCYFHSNFPSPPSVTSFPIRTPSIKTISHISGLTGGHLTPFTNQVLRSRHGRQSPVCTMFPIDEGDYAEDDAAATYLPKQDVENVHRKTENRKEVRTQRCSIGTKSPQSYASITNIKERTVRLLRKQCFTPVSSGRSKPSKGPALVGSPSVRRYARLQRSQTLQTLPSTGEGLSSPKHGSVSPYCSPRLSGSTRRCSSSASGGRPGSRGSSVSVSSPCSSASSTPKLLRVNRSSPGRSSSESVSPCRSPSYWRASVSPVPDGRAWVSPMQSGILDVCCGSLKRVRNQDGSGLTIRIPRPQSDRGSSPPVASTSPPPVPRYAQLTTSRYAHMAPLPHSGAAPVPKSKSLSTSMDKLSLGHHHDKLLASGHPQPPGSRGSTPSSGRSSAGGPSRPPSRRSPAAQQKTSRIIDGAIEKSDSPCGSEISLNSGVSSSASVKSLQSARSSSSASGRSSTELPRTTQPRSSKSQTPTRSTPVRRSSTNSSIRSSRSSTPPDLKQSTATLKAAMSATNGNARGSRSPIVATHRKNAVSSRITGINGTSPTHNTDSLKRRTASTSSVSSSSTPATGPRKMSMATSDSRGSGLQQQGSAAETTKKGLPIFNSYMSLFQVQEKLKKGEVIEGVLRINPKNYEDAYISAPGGGTDIYIGGVRDRNAALHGDLVAIELLSPQHWKVLYDQLDYFLDCDDTLKSLVYAAHDPFAVMDQFVPPDSVAPAKQQQNKEELQQATNNNNTSNNAIASDDNGGTVNAESCDAGSAKKKKGRRRGKKNKKKEKLESVDEDGTGMVNVAAEEVVAGLLSGDPPYQNVQDELILLSSNVPTAGQGVASDQARARKGAKQAIIVPPDMLSECSDVTDDESCCSDSLDLDAAHEDHTFFTAQRAAARRAKKFAEGATVELVGPSAEEASASSTGGLKIVEITDDVEVPVKMETVSGDQTGSNTGSTLVKSEGDTKVEGVSTKSEQETIKNDQQKKRLTAAERLFGDKAKKSKKNRSKNFKATAAEEIEGGMVTLAIDKEMKDSKCSGSKACSVDDCKSTDVAPQEQTQAKSEFAAYSFDDQSMQQAANSAPPRFMISPYNQQINYSASNSRAQNNWLNHPMLNNFTNTPNPQQMSYQSSNQRPSQQQQHYGQQRQQQEQQQQYGSRQQQSAIDSSKRTEPSVEQVMRLSNWGRFVQKVGYVVHILEQRNTRLGAGTLKPFADMNRSFALFSPKDSRIPRMKIPMSQCPPDLFSRRNEYAKRIYLAKITLWNDPKFALGELMRDIGRHGDIMAESEAFLLEIGIDYSEFPQEVLQELPVVPEVGWSIPEEAKAGRLDLRDRCIFSVDPATARDLDDALSCESLPGDRYRVGVHIADVSYFFPAGSELDKFAAGRATSVYLVDKVIPMLPRVLCEQLCSLNPDEDRLAFSVIWEMDRTGQIQSTWFGRTIIRSCAKLSYDHAQLVIDSPGRVDWEEHEMPPISRFPISQVCQTITALQGLAVHMRARRHRNGALRLDQSKLAFSLDRETKMPNAVTTTEHKLSNNLIEEFMLLANISVAHKIYESFPTKAVLRCHPEPQVGPLADTVNMLRCMNIEIDIASAGSIYESILHLTGDSDFSPAQLEVVVNMLSKPMQNALYFCSGSYLEDFSHYALNVPFYTHFTSPIRRYPDVMVHRLLAAAIDPERYPLADLSLDEMDRSLSVSNEKKTSAKRASEYSCELYLAEFVRQLREIHTSGIVLGVLDRSLDILLLDYCTIKRTYLEKLPLEALNYDNKSKNEPPSLHVVWSPDHKTQSPSIAQSFTYFTPVKVVLTPFTNDQLKFNVTLVRPES